MWRSDTLFGELYVHIIFHVLVTTSLGVLLTITKLHISGYKRRYNYQILTAVLTFGQESIEQFCLGTDNVCIVWLYDIKSHQYQ